MSKYINADELCEKVESVGISSVEIDIRNDILDIIDNMPPADEVKHGEWIENDNGTYSCSLCQSWIPKEQYYYARYCLHCGADMRGKAE